MTTSQDTGPLDWRIAIVDKTGRPTPEFQRRWATQRSNNALIGSVTLGSGAPTGIPSDGQEYLNISTTPFTFYVGKSKAWHQVGAVKFTDLSDVPHTYVGNDLLQVNPGGTAVQFTAPSALTANPTATAKDTAVNGTASTFMRSDAAPAIQKATSGLFGIVKVDGTTITATGGVISSVSSGGSVGPRQGSVTTPVVASFTQVNFGANTSASNGVTGIVLKDTLPTTTTNAWRLMEQTAALPATPYDLYAHVGYLSGQQSGVGITLRNSSSGKFIFIGRRQSVTNVSVWSSFSVNAANRMDNPGPGQEWLRLHNDGTTITAFMSSNGLDWQLLISETLASFLVSVDKAGFGLNPIVAASPVSQIGMLCDSFSFTAPT